MKTKIYTIRVEDDMDKGTFSIGSKNDGFNPLELIGILTYFINRIEDQMNGIIKPTEVKREVVIDD